jgi:hypothetical protein
MRGLTYSVVRNFQQQNLLRFSPRLSRTFCDDKKKDGAVSVTPETSVTPAAVETPSHHAVRRELKRQKEENMRQVKEILAENDRYRKENTVFCILLKVFFYIFELGTVPR